MRTSGKRVFWANWIPRINRDAPPVFEDFLENEIEDSNRGNRFDRSRENLGAGSILLTFDLLE